jgi:hypothetical protein
MIVACQSNRIKFSKVRGKAGPPRWAAPPQMRLRASFHRECQHRGDILSSKQPLTSAATQYQCSTYLARLLAAHNKRDPSFQANNTWETPRLQLLERQNIIAHKMATGMAQRELESQLKALLKVVGDKDSAPAAITILETLKRDVKPTEELLRVCPVFVNHIPEARMLSFEHC